jgi:hypothetical protein
VLVALGVCYLVWSSVPVESGRYSTAGSEVAMASWE